MLTFERTEDLDLVRSVFTHPKLYPWLTDDFCPPAEDLALKPNQAIWYVKVENGGELLGLFMFTPENAICWEVHTCLLPNAWRRYSLEASREVARWIWEHTPCRRIITSVPRYNRLALRLAKSSGMKVYGVNEKAWQKRGQLHDLILLGLSKPTTEV